MQPLICKYKTEHNNLHGMKPIDMVIAISHKVSREDVFILDCASGIYPIEVTKFIEEIKTTAKKYRKLIHRIFRRLLQLNGSSYAKKPFVILNEFDCLSIDEQKQLFTLIKISDVVIGYQQ